MLTISTIQQLRSVMHNWRQSSETIGLIPTMGNLHQGHLRLMEEAQKKTSKTVASIFVNPTQFGPGEDYQSYPRTEKDDIAKLEQISVDVVFIPDVGDMYPPTASTIVSVSQYSNILCGASRKGHFDGVATIVAKLFNIVQPDIAFFGEKDFQQLQVIRALVHDLNFPITIQGVPTVRESDGLALSSRNAYLSSQHRQIAPLLYQALCAAKSEVLNGESEFNKIESDQLTFLKRSGFDPEYFKVCRKHDLGPASNTDREIVILSAARLGKARLIDNIYFVR